MNIIGLCGYPESGKTTFQNLLHQQYGIIPYDDASALRKSAEILFSLTPEQTQTQEGKKSQTKLKKIPNKNTIEKSIFSLFSEKPSTKVFKIQNKIYTLEKIVAMFEEHLRSVFSQQKTVRQCLGHYGEFLEKTFGEFIKPETALKTIDPNHKIISFGSVRLNQALYYKKHPCLILEIIRNGKKAENPFDEYLKSTIDISIHNPESDLKDHTLLDILKKTVEPLLKEKKWID